jgi:hypothetical protein
MVFLFVKKSEWHLMYIFSKHDSPQECLDSLQLATKCASCPKYMYTNELSMLKKQQTMSQSVP